MGKWLRDGDSTPLERPNQPGVWEHVDVFFRPGQAIAFYAGRPSGSSDPSGATIQIGLRLGAGTPTPVDGASLTLPSLAVGQSIGIPQTVMPQGRICATIGGSLSTPIDLEGWQ